MSFNKPQAWTEEDDRRLLAMIDAGVSKMMRAAKLKRTMGAVVSRGNLLKKARAVAGPARRDC